MSQQQGPINSTYTAFCSLHFDWLEAPKNTGCLPKICLDLSWFSSVCYWLNQILAQRGNLHISVSKQNADMPFDRVCHNLVFNMVSRTSYWYYALLKIINSGLLKRNEIWILNYPKINFAFFHCMLFSGAFYKPPFPLSFFWGLLNSFFSYSLLLLLPLSVHSSLISHITLLPVIFYFSSER